MSEKMEKITDLAAEVYDGKPQEYVYNSTKQVWEAKDIIEKINEQLKRL